MLLVDHLMNRVVFTGDFLLLRSIFVPAGD